MNQDMKPLFSRLQAYSAISDAELNTLMEAAFVRVEKPRGATLIEIGEPLNHVFVVSSGWAIRHRTLDDGRRQIVNVMLPGDCFDLQALVVDRADHAVETITPVTALRASKDDFLNTIRKSGPLASAFWWTAVQEESVLREQIVRLGRRSGRERLAHLLLEVQRRLSQSLGILSPTVPFPLTRDMIADMLGLSRVHVTRSMNALKRMGLIRTSNGAVHIENVEKLARFSYFEPSYLHLSNQPRLA